MPLDLVENRLAALIFRAVVEECGDRLVLVAERARAILDWDGPPWAPSGIGLYIQEPDGRWWPRFDGTDYESCRGCRPPATRSVVGSGP